MNKDEALTILRSHEPELHKRGVKHAALFGSVARGEQMQDSDVDILIELEPGMRISFFKHVGIKLYIADLFPGRVDVINRKNLKPTLHVPIESDILYAF